MDLICFRFSIYFGSYSNGGRSRNLWLADPRLWSRMTKGTYGCSHRSSGGFSWFRVNIADHPSCPSSRKCFQNWPICRKHRVSAEIQLFTGNPASIRADRPKSGSPRSLLIFRKTWGWAAWAPWRIWSSRRTSCRLGWSWSHHTDTRHRTAPSRSMPCSGGRRIRPSRVKYTWTSYRRSASLEESVSKTNWSTPSSFACSADSTAWSGRSRPNSV